MTSFAANINSIPKVLIVDDDPGIIELIAECMREYFDFQALTAGSGNEAKALLAKHPDIAFMTCDVQLPNGNGIDFVKSARQAGSEAPILIVSSVSHQARAAVGVLKPIEFLDKLLIGKDLVGKFSRLSPEFNRLRQECSRVKAEVKESINQSAILIDDTRLLVEQSRLEIERSTAQRHKKAV
ncbi:MAG: response regulator [Proteobacteria bacterium]|nr:response regulator [Pseudomonadota bacterium]